jgi:hypothetical protein
MDAKYIKHSDISQLEKKLYKKGLLQIKPSSFYKKIPREVLLYFAYVKGIYVFPTKELVEWLKKNSSGNMIEIGAGHGAIGRSLCIPITDSRMQEIPEVKSYYAIMGQPVIEYPNDIEKLEAMEAIKKYKPSTIFGAFITHKWKDGMEDGNILGVDEDVLIKNVDMYISVINKHTHKTKPILKIPHEEHYFPWLITRTEQESNRIAIWTRK